MEMSKACSEGNGGSAAFGIENYGKQLAKLRREGKDKGDDYNAFLERYMSHSCALMCDKYGNVVTLRYPLVNSGLASVVPLAVPEAGKQRYFYLKNVSVQLTKVEAVKASRGKLHWLFM